MLRSYTIPLLFSLAFILAACVGAPPSFDEEQWDKAVQGQDTEGIYAPNQRDGEFFNPWNPMPEKSLGQLLRWRFSRTDPYTDEEETFLPEEIPDLGRRMQTLGDRDFLAGIVISFCHALPFFHGRKGRTPKWFGGECGSHYPGAGQSCYEYVPFRHHFCPLPFCLS